jgi:hypothetical protein
MTRTPSTQAQAAAAIRKELKAAFPTVKFSVTSESFSGGDAVRIDWTDGPTSESVDKIVRKYQYGHFDGMIDLYEYSNRRDDLPAQVKYVSTQRTNSRDAFLAAVDEVNTRFGWSLIPHEKWNSIIHESDGPISGGWGWQSHEVNRLLQERAY